MPALKPQYLEQLIWMFCASIKLYWRNKKLHSKFPPKFTNFCWGELHSSFPFLKLCHSGCSAVSFSASLIKSTQMFPSGSAKCQISHFREVTEVLKQRRSFMSILQSSLQGISEVICFLTWTGCIKPQLNLITLLNNGATKASTANTAGAIKRWISHILS